MLLIDVNVLVYAYREDAPNHTAYYRWLTSGSGSPWTVISAASLAFAGVTR